MTAGSSLLCGLFSSCGAQASHCGGGAWALGFAASVVSALGHSSCGLQALEHRLNSCVRGLSCPTPCGVFPDRTQVSCIGRRILYPWATRKAHFSCFLRLILVTNRCLSNYVSGSTKLVFGSLCCLASLFQDPTIKFFPPAIEFWWTLQVVVPPQIKYLSAEYLFKGWADLSRPFEETCWAHLPLVWGELVCEGQSTVFWIHNSRPMEGSYSALKWADSRGILILSGIHSFTHSFILCVIGTGRLGMTDPVAAFMELACILVRVTDKQVHKK